MTPSSHSVVPNDDNSNSKLCSVQSLKKTLFVLLSRHIDISIRRHVFHTEMVTEILVVHAFLGCLCRLFFCLLCFPCFSLCFLFGSPYLPISFLSCCLIINFFLPPRLFYFLYDYFIFRTPSFPHFTLIMKSDCSNVHISSFLQVFPRCVTDNAICKLAAFYGVIFYKLTAFFNNFFRNILNKDFLRTSQINVRRRKRIHMKPNILRPSPSYKFFVFVLIDTHVYNESTVSTSKKNHVFSVCFKISRQ